MHRDISTRRRRFLLQTTALAAASGLAPWGPGAATAAPGDRPVRIGFSLAQSGGLAGAGRSALIARQMWRDDINAKGGLLGRPVELVIYDDQSNPALVPSIYSKLIDIDKVDILWGPYGTTLAMSVMAQVKQRDRLLIGMFVTDANEQVRHDKYVNVSPFGVTSESEFTAGFAKLAARLGLKKLAILSLDVESQQLWAGINRTVAKRLGIEIVFDQKYSATTTEFSSLLRSVNASKPDAVLIASYPNDSIYIVQALDEIGLAPSVQLFGGCMIGLQNAAILQRLGSQVNGIVNIATYVPEKTLTNPALDDFFRRYAEKAREAKADELGYYMAQYAYAQGQVTEQAVKATQTLDDARLTKYLHESEMNTIVGKFRFGKTGEFTAMRMVQVQFQGIKSGSLDQFRKPGSQVVVEPPELATGTVKVPFVKARSP